MKYIDVYRMIKMAADNESVDKPAGIGAVIVDKLGWPDSGKWPKGSYMAQTEIEPKTSNIEYNPYYWSKSRDNKGMSIINPSKDDLLTSRLMRSSNLASRLYPLNSQPFKKLQQYYKNRRGPARYKAYMQTGDPQSTKVNWRTDKQIKPYVDSAIKRGDITPEQMDKMDRSIVQNKSWKYGDNQEAVS